MSYWNPIVEQYRVELISSDLPQMLTAIYSEGISVQNIRYIDELHISATISKAQLLKLTRLINKRGEDLRIQSRLGLFWKLYEIRKRPILIFGLLSIFIVCLFLESRVMFINVYGNESIPEKRIIEAANECGLSFFVPRREVRSEKIKNALLASIPQLQWVGVNTAGCVASITVRERDEVTDIHDKSIPCRIVARKDGIIQEITVLSGTPLCKVGQGVKAGDILVSGYTDCGKVIKLQQANAEVFAYTFRDLPAITPSKALHRTEKTREGKKIMLRIGKNIINLWKDSGISDTSCVKMYKENYLTLPGGFQLPIALITEYTSNYHLQENYVASTEWLGVSAEKYLTQSMVAGRILSSKCVLTDDENLYVYNGRFICLEMIGQKQYEENLINNGT